MVFIPRQAGYAVMAARLLEAAIAADEGKR
jgi:hypothetical protein